MWRGIWFLQSKSICSLLRQNSNYRGKLYRMQRSKYIYPHDFNYCRYLCYLDSLIIFYDTYTGSLRLKRLWFYAILKHVTLWQHVVFPPNDFRRALMKRKRIHSNNCIQWQFEHEMRSIKTMINRASITTITKTTTAAADTHTLTQ